MTRIKIEPLRDLIEEEKSWLEKISRSQSEPAGHVTRAKRILGVSQGKTYTEAAHQSGRESGDSVSHLVSRFNKEGLNAIQAWHEGGPPLKYGVNERERILQEVRCQPEPERDGTFTWSLKTLCAALRKAPDGFPEISEYTIRTVLRESGFSWQQSRSWCETGHVLRKRKRGVVKVTDPQSTAKKLN
jgi:transposase